MDIMVCKIHGRVEFVETCEHIASCIDNKKIPDGHRLTILGNLFICDGCFTSLGFERSRSLADLPMEDSVRIDDGRWEAFEAAYGAIEGRRSYCLKCIAELEQQNASAPFSGDSLGRD
jgi:hypothetical protein